MLSIQGSSVLRRIVVLNPKGGAGKTTLAFNLAGYLASTGRRVALVDMDEEAFSKHWLVQRPAEFPEIHGVSDFPYIPGQPLNATIPLPANIDFAIVDTPAGVSREDLADFIVGSHAIIVPVMPSEIDIHSAIRLIADLLLVARGSRDNKRLGVIANRVKERTHAANHLMTFLNRLSIPVIGVTRDSQNYVNAAREGLCIHELTAARAGKDLWQWKSITRWLEQRLDTPLNEKDLPRTKPRPRHQQPQRRRSQPPVDRLDWRLVAAMFALVVVSTLLWLVIPGPDEMPATTPTAVREQVAEQRQTPPARSATRPTSAAEPTLPGALPVVLANSESAMVDRKEVLPDRPPAEFIELAISEMAINAQQDEKQRVDAEWYVSTADGWSISSDQLADANAVAFAGSESSPGDNGADMFFEIIGDSSDDTLQPANNKAPDASADSSVDQLAILPDRNRYLAVTDAATRSATRTQSFQSVAMAVIEDGYMQEDTNAGWYVATANGAITSSEQSSAPTSVAFAVIDRSIGDDYADADFDPFEETAYTPDPPLTTQDPAAAAGNDGGWLATTINKPETGLEPQPMVTAAVAKPRQRPGLSERSAAIERKWQLAGVIKRGGGQVVLLTDITNGSTRSITRESNIDGWRLKEAGKGFAVLTRNGREIRLTSLHDESTGN